MLAVLNTRGTIAKRAFDLLLSVAGMIALAPLFLAIAILIKCTSPGPVLYRARRAGRHGRPFTLYKFRTMVVNADRMGAGITAHDDPRITKVGQVLRRSKLDELPQLWNVVKGDMSLVGPRPEDPRYVADYTSEQRRVLSVRPGITGWASIQYRHEEQLLGVGNVDDVYRTQIMPHKLALDLEYVEQQSLGLDLLILFKTVLAVFG